MNITPTSYPGKDITLRDLSLKKAELKQKIELQQEKIVATSGELFSPLSSATSSSTLVRSFKTGLAIFDGVLIGIKLMRKIRKYFHLL